MRGREVTLVLRHRVPETYYLLLLAISLRDSFA